MIHDRGERRHGSQSRASVAVIGAGVAGLTAAYLLQRQYEVTLFEADSRLGGHAHTHEIPSTSGGTAAVDTGFLVHNERTYPNLMRLFGELGVRTQDSDMSMSVRCLECGLEYAGGKRLTGLLPEMNHLRTVDFLRMLAEVTRFHRRARRFLEQSDPDEATFGSFLAAGGHSQYFVDHFALPLVSAVWSAGEQVSLQYPARYLFEFLNNHGMLSVGGAFQWKTVTGGSRNYVERAAKNLTAVQIGTPVRAVTRHSTGVEIRDQAGQVHQVDRVVLATHADQALALLGDPTPAERRALGAFTYSRNETWLHSDTDLLPRLPRARASWNYLKSTCRGGADGVGVSYDINRLMRLPGPDEYVVTLNPAGRVDPARVIATMVYEHPVYTRETVAAQRLLPGLNGPRTAFAGAYHGWGFHEDGCASGVRAAEAFGAGW
ncbi:MAG TPA: FAD-dependent oxidoreductase [Jiangellaceae bacterium]|nr:FAD-dependent oxidoreductase [Jiangellaceae bacterium]